MKKILILIAVLFLFSTSNVCAQEYCCIADTTGSPGYPSGPPDGAINAWDYGALKQEWGRDDCSPADCEPEGCLGFGYLCNETSICCYDYGIYRKQMCCCADYGEPGNDLCVPVWLCHDIGSSCIN